jgi:hypothetical protein
VHYHLQPLTLQETRAYIRHRLAVAGATDDIFGDLALACVHYFTAGVPRLINSVCDMALVYGFAAETPQISWETIAEVARDRELGNLLTLPHPIGSMTRDELRAELIRLSGDTFGEEEFSPRFVVAPTVSRQPQPMPELEINGSSAPEWPKSQAQEVPIEEADEDYAPETVLISTLAADRSLKAVREIDDAPYAPRPLAAQPEFAPTPKLLRARTNPQISTPRARKWSLW